LRPSRRSRNVLASPTKWPPRSAQAFQLANRSSERSQALASSSQHSSSHAAHAVLRFEVSGDRGGESRTGKSASSVGWRSTWVAVKVSIGAARPSHRGSPSAMSVVSVVSLFPSTRPLILTLLFPSTNQEPHARMDREERTTDTTDTTDAAGAPGFHGQRSFMASVLSWRGGALGLRVRPWRRRPVACR
jgi:hypothetical protein